MLKSGARAAGMKFGGIMLAILAVSMVASLMDSGGFGPAPNAASTFPVTHFMGRFGADLRGFLVQYFGAGLAVIIGAVAISSVRLLAPAKLRRGYRLTMFMAAIGLPAMCLGFARWGMGGIAGAALAAFVGPAYLATIMGLAVGFAALYFVSNADMGKLARLRVAAAVPRFIRRGPRPPEPASAPEQRQKPAAPKPRPAKARPADEDYVLPPIGLLDKPRKDGIAVSGELNRQKARMLEDALAEFNIDVRVVDIRTGPVVTLFEMEVGRGVKISRITSLSEDIASKMSAYTARVALIPGTNRIGIELPNIHRKMIYLRELFESSEYDSLDYALPIPLGQDIGGRPVFADLARMPHLLIAGTTGSGKSVGVNGMILSILFRYAPDEVKMILIDPKMVEFAMFREIPHLLIPVVADSLKAVAALKWAVREMDERNRNMSSLGAKNIESFNEKARRMEGRFIVRDVLAGFDSSTGEELREERRIPIVPMPYIVIVVDEIQNLMQAAGKDVEGAVSQLSAMARAAGIHLVISTQSPRVNVITGTIKANLPNRIAYRVISKIDSRTIIDESGAEMMLGKGDMLYMAMGGALSRVHGAFVSEDEIGRVAEFVKRQRRPDYVEAVTVEQRPAFGAMGAADRAAIKAAGAEELYAQALDVIRSADKPSISYLQRRLGIGYNKAANIIERMQDEGVLSRPDSQNRIFVIKK
ncbi:MAG: DNA translocase FtsK [Rickettsiales bacterium]|nr:DNA translocase FtsK [Rickettsiales bacterium]